jgi:hypothetical protein
MMERYETHLFEYEHGGATWTLQIKATSEADARARLDALRDGGSYLGVLQMKLPVELGVFVKLICWWKNRNTTGG